MTMPMSDDSVDYVDDLRYQMTVSIAWMTPSDIRRYQMISDDSVDCVDDPVRCLNVELFHQPRPGSTFHGHTFAANHCNADVD